jgi:hypothetical protein
VGAGGRDAHGIAVLARRRILPSSPLEGASTAPSNASARTPLRGRSDLIEHRPLPAVYGFREFVDAGGLMAYGTNVSQACRRATEYVDKILTDIETRLLNRRGISSW